MIYVFFITHYVIYIVSCGELGLLDLFFFTTNRTTLTSKAFNTFSIDKLFIEKGQIIKY